MFSLENYDLRLSLQRGVAFADPNGIGYSPAIAATLPIGDPYGTVVVGNYIYAVAAYFPGIVRKVSLATGLAVLDILVGDDPRGVCYDGTNIWCANYNPNGPGTTVSKIAVASDTVVATITVGNKPGFVEYDGHGYVWVACLGSTNTYKINIATNAVTVIPLGITPGCLAYDNRGYMYFGGEGFAIVKRVHITKNIVTALPVPTGIYGMCSAASYLWMTNFGDKIHRINRMNSRIVTFKLDHSPTRRPSFDGKRVWVPCGASGFTVVIDTETSAVVASINTNAGSNRFVCFDAANAYISAPTGLIKVPLF